MVMIYVPGAEFETSLGRVVALDDFWIDRTEVRNAQYRRCVDAGGCEPPLETSSYSRDVYYVESDYDDYPVTWVNYDRAAAYCEWAGARLPDEAEWEYAARGPERRRFPWGDDFDGVRLNFCDANCTFGMADEMVDDGYIDTSPVGRFPTGASWCGARDLAGNVWEWVANRYDGATDGGYRVMRGGSWLNHQALVRADVRYPTVQTFSGYYVGFRCAGLREE